MIIIWIIAVSLYVFCGFILPELLQRWIDRMFEK